MSDLLEEYRVRLRQAMAKLGEQEAELAAGHREKHEPIAIIGMGCRFPAGVKNPEEFYANLAAGSDAVTQVPRERTSLGRLRELATDPALAAAAWGGFIKDPELFDADFFGIAPREVRSMDPQQRLLLEVSWEALERAGQVPEALSGSAVGVFMGMSAHDYAELCINADRDGADIYTATGNGPSFAAGRLSYAFGFHGPSLTVDTACSSSLVAVHLAAQSLRNGECALALAGGVNLMLSATTTLLLARSHALSPDGRCKAFDARANGFVRGEGCGIVVLKRLGAARRDGDPILALLVGSAVNQDGRSTGLTAPNVLSQQQMLRQALDNARVAAAQLSYIETHGTGTSLGDPIELEALKTVLGAATADAAPCVLGAVKTNIGHLEAAAGIAGLMKAVQSFHNEAIPGNLHFSTLNPRLTLDGCRLVIPTATTPWPRGPQPRLCGISSFGFSGTNAHLVLQEPPLSPEAPAVSAPRAAYLLPISAKSPQALRDLVASYATLLSGDPAPSLHDLLYTAGQRRSHHSHRLAVVGGSVSALGAALHSYLGGELSGNVVTGTAQSGLSLPVVFVFPGQGSQWAGMATALRESEPVFRAAIEAIDALVQHHTGWSVLQELAAPAASSRLAFTEVAQPVLFAVSVALSALYHSLGVRPDAVLGHSVGEIAAAHVAGILTLEEAVRLVCLRGRVMSGLHGLGKMAAVSMTQTAAEEAARRTGGAVSLAAINAPDSVVLAGDPQALDALLKELTAQGHKCKLLGVEYAFHSHQMRQVEDAFRTTLGTVARSSGTLPMYSTVSGQRVQGSALDGAYWRNNLVDPVRFADAVHSAAQHQGAIFIEVGPHPVLSAPIARTLELNKLQGQVLGTLRKGQGEPARVLQTVAALYVGGYSPSWSGINGASGQVIPLPAYPWQHQRYWVEGAEALVRAESVPAAPLPASAPARAATPVEGETASPLLLRLRSASPVTRKTLLADFVQRAVDQVLGRDATQKSPPLAGFFDLGLDSVMALELRTRLQSGLGLALQPTVVFDYPTIVALTEHLSTLLLSSPPAALPSFHPLAPAEADEPIAVVGMACRFPGGANDPASFWQLLRGAHDGTSEVPADRWDRATYYDPDPDAAGKMYTGRSGFLQGAEIDKFDAGFFNISPLEARSLDPQQRLLLELAWEALESAGLPADRLVGSRTGVFVGIATTDYGQLVQQVGLERLEPYMGTGNTLSTAAGRLSFFLGLRGPTVALDTACSSSLVALHLGCQSLSRGESDQVLIGGVNLILTPLINVLYSRMRALAPDGRCKTFDAAADGMVRGEGGAVIVLKRYRDAVRSGDNILALVRGSAVNHDGRASGLTVPNGAAQREVLRAALASARVSPSELQFLETHGTGTLVGDPIEVNAVIAELAPSRPAELPLVLGSAKANVGHLEAAAGLVGLIKVVLCMQHGEIPAQLHYQTLNPRISPGRFPLIIPTQTIPWPARDGRSIAGVSSFGMSGTNAHVVLEAAPPREATAQAVQSAAFLLPISAQSSAALSALARAYQQLLTDCSNDEVPDLCYSAAARRTHLECRLAVVGSTRQELLTAVTAFVDKELHPRCLMGTARLGEPPRLAFVFSGHSGHWVGMGRTLLNSEPAFAAAFHACNQAMSRHVAWSLAEQLFADDAEARWEQPAIVQPLVFALQVALAALWRSWGVEPAAIVGHSMGEIAAAHCSGALSLDDAARLCCERSALLATVHGQGAMAVVGLPLTEATAALAGYEDRLSVAVSNSRASTVLSGDPAALAEVLAKLNRRNVFTRALKGATGAGHSPQMEPVAHQLVGILAGLQAVDTDGPLYSTVTAGRIAGSELVPQYWGRNLREPVLFAQTVEQMGSDGYDAFLEIGPHPLLLGAIEQILRPQGGALTAVASLKSGEPERATLLLGLGRLYVAGYPIDWTRLHPDGGRLLPLPAYPWQRQRHWLSVPASTAKPASRAEPVREDSREAARQRVKESWADWLYQLDWQLAPSAPSSGATASRTVQTGTRAAPQTWLLLEDAGGFGQRLAHRLEQRGDCVIRQRFDPQTAENPATFERMLAAAQAAGPLHGVVHLWGLDAAPAEQLTVASLHTAQTLGCVAVLHLVQALAGAKKGPRLWVVTSNVHQLADSQRAPAVGQSALWGLGKVVALEHPELWGSLIDLSDERTVDEELALLRELEAAEHEEDLIALRGGQRYVARLTRSAAPPMPDAPLQLRADGAYLITGGLGGVGLQVARWLAERGARHLTIVGRRALPPAGATLPADSAARPQLAAVQELERRGITVRVLAADVGDAAAMAEVMASIDRSGLLLRGVAHVAGISAPSALVDTTADSLRALGNPKVAGTLILHELTRTRPLDFFVCFSSAAALWGGAGLGSYAAANHFLDTFAHYRRTLGLPALSVNWGGWSGGGMTTDAVQRIAAQMGLHVNTPAELLEALDAFLQAGTTQITIGQVDWRLFKPIYEARRRRPLIERMAVVDETEVAARGSFARLLAEGDAPSRWELLLTHVGELAAGVLGFEDPGALDRQQGFFQMGMDSIMSVRLRNQLELSLGKTLPPTLAFEHPTVEALADYLAQWVLDLIPPRPTAPSAASARSPSRSAEDAALEGMSEAELEALLAAELGVTAQEELS